MANHQRRAISQYFSNLLLYAPACRQDEFLNAIGYLVRRLDENTGEQNFLRHAYRLTPGSKEFLTFASDFETSVARMSSVGEAPRREQNRFEAPTQPSPASQWSEYINEPDTDWSVPINSAWAEGILDHWKSRCNESANRIESADDSDSDHRWNAETTDPSRPTVVVCRYQTRTIQDVRDAVNVACQDQIGWRQTSVEHRHELLRAVAQLLRERRAELIGAMVAEAGKTVAEADPEVSEAIDFCEFYPLTVYHWLAHASIEIEPRGVVAVISPWNFPLAIPCGGIAAALSAGNSVLLKPSSHTVMVAALLCQTFWDAGVPRDALQFVPCDGSVAGDGLVANEQVDTVILTGGTATAKRMLQMRPNLHLLAETGGKNATIVTAMADRDLAIKHVLHSAFGHSGQKCSATSLLLLEYEVFQDEKFQSTLADAVESIRVGSAWDLETKVGPLISPPRDELARGLKTLEDDESWLVVPEHVTGNPNLYKPGVKWNVKPGGFTHRTELFGPVLGVMPFSKLSEAIEIVGSTGYGLTSGLESLDEREIELWKQSIHAGNLYINRPTTGAIVLRQPFGGIGLSAYGPGIKTGGPHYTLALMKRRDRMPTDQTQIPPKKSFDTPLCYWVGKAVDSELIDGELGAELRRVIASGNFAMESEFSGSHDTVGLVGQDNERRYRPVDGLTIRVTNQDSRSDALKSLCLAVTAGAAVTVSVDPEVSDATSDLLESTADAMPSSIHPIEETDTQLACRIADGGVVRLRLLLRANPDSQSVIQCGQAFVTIVDEPVLADGRIECLNYLDEQSISHDYHRYGNLGRRTLP